MVNIAVSVPNHAKCEVHSVIWFLCAKGKSVADIYRQLVSSKDVMIRQNMQSCVMSLKWEEVMFIIRKQVEGHLLSFLKPFKYWRTLHVDWDLTKVNFMNNVQNYHKLFFMKWTERLGYWKMCAYCVPKSWQKKSNDCSTWEIVTNSIFVTYTISKKLKLSPWARKLW